MPSLEVVQILKIESDDDDRTVEFEKDEEKPNDLSSPTRVKASNATAKPAPLPMPTEETEVVMTKVSQPSKPVKHVTPTEENDSSTSSTSSSKQKQQRKVNQMTLGNFFFGVQKQPIPSSPCNSTPTPKKRGGKAVTTKGRGEALTVAANKAKRIDFDLKPAEETENDTAAATTTTAVATATAETIDLSEEAEEEKDCARKPAETKPKDEGSPEKEPPREESVPLRELPEERKALLQKHSLMKTKYSQRSQELLKEARKGLMEEKFVIPEPQPKKEDSSSDDDSFTDHVIANMVLLIEGSSQPLSKLATNISQKLSEWHERPWKIDAVTNKVKLLAKRKSYIDNDTSNKSIDLFEDESQDRMWRWEILTIDILPSEVLPKVRKARSARKKISSHRTATRRLIQSLSEAETVIADAACPDINKQIAKVSQNEERVLKFEREAEKKRMVELAKKKKQEEAENNRKEKEHKKVEAEQKKMEKKKEAETKKQEAAKAREEEKRKKIAEKEEKKKSEDESKKKKLNMQKACLRSFFSAPPEKKARKIFSGNTTKDCKSTDQSRSNSSTSAPSSSFDIDAFRSMVNSSESHDRKSLLIPKLSSQAVANRKRRTRTVTLSVYVTVMPEENAFNAQPFAEQQDIKVRNKYRFLSFHEDCRPPYHGTWSKRSTIVTGKSPFAKDTTHLDYDYDSEAEWEEGDDEIGEDIEDEEKCKDEDEDEGDARIYDYDDGFCVADDRYLDTDDSVDEETRALYKKKLQKGEGHGSLASRLCIIAPVQGGIPPSGDDFFTHLVEGFEKAEGMDLLSSHQGLELCDLRLCLDAFPPRHPAVVDEAQASAKVAVSSSGDATGRDEYSPEEMRSLARFSHHCELNSKEKLIESLRNAHPEMFTSRAKATRKLDCIAVKKRRGNASGVYWEVKKEILEELGLQDVLAKKLVEAVETEALPKAGVSSKKKTKTQAKRTKTGRAKKETKSKSTTKPKSTTKTGKKRRRTEDEQANDSAKAEKANINDDKKPSPKKASSPKKSQPHDMKASANFMAGFLIRKKPKSPSTN